MKSSRLIILATLCISLLAVSSFAGERHIDITGWASYVDTNSDGTFNSSTPNQAFDISFDGKLGYGAAINVFWSQRVSTEFSASEVRPNASSRTRAAGPGAGNSIGDVKMIPLTATLQYHFAPNGRIDPYIGAGAAYVLFDNLGDIHDAANVGLNQIDFKDDVGLVINGGIGIQLTQSVALLADVKYVPLKSSATAVFATGANSSQKLKINPVIASAGISFRF